jgi:hypothetical protein
MVVHVDQHANDFNTLFEVLHNDSERYSIASLNILGCITSNVHMSSSETGEFSDKFVTQELDQVHPQDARITISLRKRSQTCKYIRAWL